MPKSNKQEWIERRVTVVFRHLTPEQAAALPPADELYADARGAEAMTAALKDLRPEVFCVAVRDTEADGACHHAEWHHQGGVCVLCAEDDERVVRKYPGPVDVSERILFAHAYRPGRVCPDADQHDPDWNGDQDTACPRCHMFGVTLEDGSEAITAAQAFYGSEA